MGLNKYVSSNRTLYFFLHFDIYEGLARQYGNLLACLAKLGVPSAPGIVQNLDGVAPLISDPPRNTFTDFPFFFDDS